MIFILLIFGPQVAVLALVILIILRTNAKSTRRLLLTKESMLRPPGTFQLQRLRATESEIGLQLALLMLGAGWLGSGFLFFWLVNFASIPFDGEVRSVFLGMVAVCFVGIIIILAGARKLILLRGQQYRHWMGYQGEIFVGQELNLLMQRGWHVFHDITLPGLKIGNLDHLLVGPKGVYVVETKHYSSNQRGAKRSKDKGIKGLVEEANPTPSSPTVRYDGKAIYLHGKGPARTKEIKQLNRTAAVAGKWLSKTMGEEVWVEPVLVLPGWKVNYPKIKRGVRVIEVGNLVKSLPNRESQELSKQQVDQVAALIRAEAEGTPAELVAVPQ